MKRWPTLQFLKFLLVGGFNTGFSYAVYAALLYVGLSYAAANVGAAILGTLFSFRTQGRFVFANRDASRFQRFAACWALLCGLNIGLVALGVRAGLDAYAAGALALVPVTLASFVLNRHFVFGATPPGAAGCPASHP